MKTYIFLIAIAGYISGGNIYYRNKIKYLKEHNWNVVVFPIYDGKIYINGLEEYAGKAYSFLDDFPNEYSKKDRDIRLQKMACEVPDSDEIIIETGSDYTAYWGELLAKKLGARHFHFLLDEKNPRITREVFPFYEFKYKRHELACITAQTMKKYFDGYMDVKNAYFLKAVCSNSTENFDSPITDKIPKNEYMLGYIGRPSKSFFKPVLKGVIAFADEVYPKRVTFTIFGGDNSEVIKGIEEECKNQNNIDLFITGYMFPFPEKAILAHNLFISGAGSRYASANLGVPTVSMDVYNNRPIDMVVRNDQPFTSEEYDGKTVLDYIKQVLIKGDYPKATELQPIGLDYAFKEFDKHMEFLAEADNDLKYFSIEALPLNKKQKVFKLLRKIFGNDNFEKIRNIKRKIKE